MSQEEEKKTKRSRAKIDEDIQAMISQKRPPPRFAGAAGAHYGKDGATSQSQSSMLPSESKYRISLTKRGSNRQTNNNNLRISSFGAQNKENMKDNHAAPNEESKDELNHDFRCSMQKLHDVRNDVSKDKSVLHSPFFNQLLNQTKQNDQSQISVSGFDKADGDKAEDEVKQNKSVSFKQMQDAWQSQNRKQQLIITTSQNQENNQNDASNYYSAQDDGSDRGDDNHNVQNGDTSLNAENQSLLVNTFGTPSSRQSKKQKKRPSANASMCEINQSYTEQLERRVSDLNMTVALKNKEIEETKRLEREQVNPQVQQQLEEKNKFIQVLLQQIKSQQTDIQSLQIENQNLNEQDQNSKFSIKELMQKLEIGEKKQQEQHNHIQHLRGSMRVYCRIKPLQSLYPIGSSILDTGIPQPTSGTNTPTQQQAILRKSTDTELNSCFIMGVEGATKDIVTGRILPPTSVQLAFSMQEIYDYFLDGIFGPDSSQFDIFEEIKPFVKSSIDGENVCVFAYGQTSSGKTYTMEGPNKDLLFDETDYTVHNLSGILPRTAVFLFEEQKRLQGLKSKSFSLEISAIEIYCDKLRDLFCEDEETQGLEIDIKTDPKTKKNIIQNQTWKQLTEVHEFLEFIKLSADKRVFGQNGWNAHSSRSHHIFQIKIKKEYTKSGKPQESLLNIIDLAGSERRTYESSANDSQPFTASMGSRNNNFSGKASVQTKQMPKTAQFGASMPSIKKKNAATSQPTSFRKPGGNQTIKKQPKTAAKNPIVMTPELEGTFINTSLSVLGRIFTILANRGQSKEKVPPYRECKLTRILQDSLTLQGKTVMIVNVCSEHRFIKQTKVCLDFAAKASQVYSQTNQ